MYKKAFTLIEMMIAMAISALMMSGLYVMFNSVLNAKDSLETSNDQLYQLQALERIISRDIRMMSSAAATFPAPSGDEKYLFTLFSQDSLTFNKAIPVNIAYIYDNETVYREERLNDMNYIMRIPLISGVTEWTTESFDGSKYNEGLSSSAFIFRFTFKMKNRVQHFTTGRVVDVTS